MYDNVPSVAITVVCLVGTGKPYQCYDVIWEFPKSSAMSTEHDEKENRQKLKDARRRILESEADHRGNFGRINDPCYQVRLALS